MRLLLLPFWVCPVWGCLLRWLGRRWWGWAAPGSRTLLWFLQSSLRQCDSYPEPAPGPEGGSGRVSNECFYIDAICHTQSNSRLTADLILKYFRFLIWRSWRCVTNPYSHFTPWALLITVQDNLNITNEVKTTGSRAETTVFPFQTLSRTYQEQNCSGSDRTNKHFCWLICR